MNSMQFNRLLDALVGAYIEEGHGEQEIRDDFERILKTHLPNQTEVKPGAVIVSEDDEAEMMSFIEKAYLAMRKVGEDVPSKERMEIPLKIMYLIHSGKYIGFFDFIDNSGILAGGILFETAEKRILGKCFGKLYLGIRYLLSAYNNVWYRNSKVFSMEDDWKTYSFVEKLEILENVEDALYKDMKAYSANKKGGA